MIKATNFPAQESQTAGQKVTVSSTGKPTAPRQLKATTSAQRNPKRHSSSQGKATVPAQKKTTAAGVIKATVINNREFQTVEPRHTKAAFKRE
ncbi:hypothetical protein MA16_Dca029173 [Dendrobium catenatum]|uniref:Uncharacterized protein n=1 Tax=Dendrobium catenatum TaxID=906689 RepID=A0A2I0VA60_9ASPA|nr:hypothetical protein MA16_Dca029173 [Dendrobium catenatum]